MLNLGQTEISYEVGNIFCTTPNRNFDMLLRYLNYIGSLGSSKTLDCDSEYIVQTKQMQELHFLLLWCFYGISIVWKILKEDHDSTLS